MPTEVKNAVRPVVNPSRFGLSLVWSSYVSIEDRTYRGYNGEVVCGDMARVSIFRNGTIRCSCRKDNEGPSCGHIDRIRDLFDVFRTMYGTFYASGETSDADTTGIRLMNLKPPDEGG